MGHYTPESTIFMQLPFCIAPLKPGGKMYICTIHTGVRIHNPWLLRCYGISSRWSIVPHEGRSPQGSTIDHRGYIPELRVIYFKLSSVEMAS